MYNRLLVAVMVMAPLAFGWGETGHRVIARLAASQVQSPEAKARILAILDGDSDTSCRQTDLGDRLACIATWADDIKRTTMRQTRNWHFVDVPVKETSYAPDRDCKDTAGGDCIINAAFRSYLLLANPPAGTTPQAKAEALKFLVHLIGDITQPLHAIDDHDSGGNGKVATWFGEPNNKWGHWNLHSVWDDGLFDRSPVGGGAEAADVAYTKVLLGRGLPAVPFGDPMAKLMMRAIEAHGVAVKVTYGALPTPQQGKLDGPEKTDKMFYALGAEYEEKCLPAAELQLLRGGAHLADALQSLFAQ